MNVFRFMSTKEFLKYRAGETLKNTTNHCIDTKRNTESVGFCFFSAEDYTPEEAMHFVSGIVSFDYCVVFEVDDKLLKKSKGKYAEPIQSTGNPLLDLVEAFTNHKSFYATEYCTTEYNNEDFKMVKYASNLWNQWEEHEKQKELVWQEVK